MRAWERGSAGARAILFALTLSLAQPFSEAAEAAATGGAYSLDAQAVGGGGRTAAGIFESLSAVQAAAGRVATGGGADALSGFLRAYYANLYVQALGTVNPVLVCDSVEFGVGYDTPVRVAFTAPILPASLVPGTTVTLVYDRMGNRVDRPVAVTLASYDPTGAVATLQAVGGWEDGATYRVDVGVQTLDLLGTPMASPASQTFRTLLNFANPIVVLATGDENSRLELPGGALQGSGLIVFRGGPALTPEFVSAEVLAEANRKVTLILGRQAEPQSLSELTLYNPAGQAMAANFLQPATLRLDFLDQNNDGLVDGVAAPARTSRLGLWTLDEEHGLWVRVTGSSVDLAQRRASGSIPHLSLYALIATADSDVSQAYAFPVPWRPFSADPARYGTAAGGITFANIPQTGTIRIYTLSGLLVREQAMDGSFTWVWDGRTRSGTMVASGTYLWIAQSGGNTKTGKLMVIR